MPYRAIFEELGYTVSWDAATQGITATKDKTSIAMKIGNKSSVINGKVVNSDVAPILLSDRTLVPLRLVSELSSCDVLWNGETNTVAMYRRTRMPCRTKLAA